MWRVMRDFARGGTGGPCYRFHCGGTFLDSGFVVLEVKVPRSHSGVHMAGGGSGGK